ncbi:ATP-binding protein [Ideonella sp.]|uniref:hybrid sensor histidine kinase/response regulator n=1 Tax=Ideonella sp. TaxID=1929293 RepID=UPI003BB566E2
MDALQSLPCPCLRLDAKGLIVASNPALQAMVGLSADVLAGRPFDSLLTVPSRVLYQSHVQPLLRLHGHLEELALSLRGAGAEPIDVLFYAARRQEAVGQLIDVVLAPIRRRRRIEDEMQRIKRAADLAPGLIFQLMIGADGQACFPYASEAIRHLYGVSPEQAAHDADCVFRQLHVDDAPTVLAVLKDPLNEGPAGWMANYRVHRASDSTWRWHEMQATQRRLANGVLLWHGHIADVSERRELEAAQAARETLEQISRSHHQFLARVSHEFRTPLNGILGFAQLLCADPAARFTAEQRDRLELIRSSGLHLLQLVNEVLEITQIESGQLAVDLRPVELQPQLERALRVMEPQALQAGVQLQPLETPAGLAVLADEQRLHQVLMNLLANAVKYNRPGGRVRLWAELAADQRVRMVVEDEGPGFSEQDMAELFQPFRRLQADPGVEGSGLGLAICKQLMALMGGEIGVASGPGRGAQFSIWLPAATQAQPLAPPESPGAAFATDLAPDPPSEAAPSWRYTVVYVEDHPVNAMLMEAIVGLQPQVRLLVAESGERGLTMARAEQPDLFLLDMHLPDTTGMALLASLRQIPELRSVPAVMVSAAARQDDIDLARSRGFEGYWTKPLDVDHTLRELARLLPGLS